jgi:hypothetical protein
MYSLPSISGNMHGTSECSSDTVFTIRTETINIAQGVKIHFENLWDKIHAWAEEKNYLNTSMMMFYRRKISVSL